MKLKILTQNLHCLVEEDIKTKQRIIAEKIAEKDLDIVFLQEVAQSQVNPGFRTTKMADDNYALTLQKLLEEKGLKYYLYYEPVKASFGIYDEGVGMLSKYPLELLDSKLISRTTDYYNWKSRKVLVYKLVLEGRNITLATTHFGWSDGYEVFEDQFDLASEVVFSDDLAILAGDYNIYTTSNEYKHIMSKGWLDIFKDNTEFFNKSTFRGDDTHNEVRRIDYIMTNKPIKLLNQEILFVDKRVSDHYGVYVEIEII